MTDRSVDPHAAAALLRSGGLLIYPTESVWGLGCDPFDDAALARLLALKQRAASKGLILIAADLDQLAPLIDLHALTDTQRKAVVDSWPGPFTWTVPCSPRVPAHLRGEHETLAVRVTAHPVAAALCRAFGAPLVSTSANLAGQPAPRARADIDPQMLAGVDALVAGETGDLAQPTAIRDARSGAVLRG